MGEDERDQSLTRFDAIGPTPELDRLRAWFGERLGYFLRGHGPAILFVETVLEISHVWDDLIDHDREVPDEEIMTAFWQAIVMLPANPFYQQHFTVLHPILTNSIVSWRAATALERRGGEHERTIASILRCAAADVITMSALLVGGQAWSVEVAPEIRQWIHDETYVEYLDHLQGEEVRRDARRRRR